MEAMEWMTQENTKTEPEQNKMNSDTGHPIKWNSISFGFNSSKNFLKMPPTNVQPFFLFFVFFSPVLDLKTSFVHAAYKMRSHLNFCCMQLPNGFSYTIMIHHRILLEFCTANMVYLCVHVCICVWMSLSLSLWLCAIHFTFNDSGQYAHFQPNFIHMHIYSQMKRTKMHAKNMKILLWI